MYGWCECLGLDWILDGFGFAFGVWFGFGVVEYIQGKVRFWVEFGV